MEPDADKEGSNNISIDIVEENKDQGDNRENNQVKRASIMNAKKEVEG